MMSDGLEVLANVPNQKPTQRGRREDFTKYIPMVKRWAYTMLRWSIRKKNIPLIVLAAKKNMRSGSSRDWGSQKHHFIRIKARNAEATERNHRSNR